MSQQVVNTISAVTFNANEVPVSVDLVETARFLLDFLSDVSTKPELYEGPMVECAIQRYERYWLPLVAKHPGRLLPAPLDIEWVWHCHMICPEAYSTDCKNIVGKLIDHHLIDRAQRKELIKDSERLWRKEYTDVPFSACDAVTPWFDCEFVSALTYRLTAAVARQRTFFYQVSLPHYRDEHFLKNALLRYKKFLFLKSRNPEVFLIPCFDSDLMWHTHMLHPNFYQDDTMAYFGHLLPYDDSVNNRAAYSKLPLLEAKTRNLWRKAFNEKYSYFGAMYRGEPPNSDLYVMSKEDIWKICTKQADILIEKICISGLPANKTYKLKLFYNTGYQNFNRSLFVTENIASVKGTSRTLEDSKVNTYFRFDTRYNDKIYASLRQKSGKLCLGTSDIVGEGKVDLLMKIQTLGNKGLTASDDLDCGDGLSIEMVWSCPAPFLGPCVLRLEPGDYLSCIMPEDRESMWGPIPLPRLPAGVESVCSVASHKLYNHTKKVVFTVRMIHSEPLLMSAIHVFFGEKMTAVAHLVVGDQIPLPNMVNEPKKCITLNPREGQRAVLIKNQKGDWGVAVGWWAGFQRRVAGRKGSCSEGHLEVRFFHLPSNRWHYVSFDRLYSLATSKFEIGDCIVEFDSGFIEINSDRGDIAENLALIFSVALIHVLCQPRPLNWNPKWDTISPEIEPPPRLGGSEEIALLLAAGVLIATPSNHAIRNLFKMKKQKAIERNLLKLEQKKKLDQLEPNGGPAKILQDTLPSRGWGEGWNSGKITDPVDAAGTALLFAGALAMMKDKARSDGKVGGDVKASSGNRGSDAEVDTITDRTALLLTEVEKEGGDMTGVVNDSNETEKDDTSPGSEEARAEDREDDEEEESDKVSEGVFEAENFNLDANSRTALFGNGEDDSDEADVENDAEDEAGFGQGSSGDDEYILNNSHESDKFHGNSSYMDPSDSEDGGFENDMDSYYDEFYNIEGDDNTSFTESGLTQNDIADRNVWDIYGDDTANLTNETNTDYGGLGTSTCGEADNPREDGVDTGYGGEALFGKDSCLDGHDKIEAGYSDFTSGLMYETEVDYGAAGSGGGGVIYSDGICSVGAGSGVEAGAGDGESGC